MLVPPSLGSESIAGGGGSEEHSVLSGVLGSRWAGRPAGMDAAWMARALRTGRLDKRQKQAVRELAQCMEEETWKEMMEELRSIAEEQGLVGAHARQVMQQHTKGGDIPQEHMAPVRQKVQHQVPKSVQKAWTQGGRGRKLRSKTAGW